MLEWTFCHLDGIGTGGESRLWECGIVSWRDFEMSPATVLSARAADAAREQIAPSRRALQDEDAGYFMTRLPQGQAFRIFQDFRDRLCYVDIETTGLTADDVITAVAVYSNGRVRVYVRGIDLDQLPGDWNRSSILVTFNGDRFDVPFLRRVTGMDIPNPHIDLYRECRALGFRGGLKRIETIMGIKRINGTDMDGAGAVELWRRYRAAGDDEALRTLCRYVKTDALSLELIAATIYEYIMGECPMPVSVTLPDIHNGFFRMKRCRHNYI